MNTYTCSQCLNEVHYIYQDKLCSICYQRAGHDLTFPEWEQEMKYKHPGKAWND